VRACLSVCAPPTCEAETLVTPVLWARKVADGRDAFGRVSIGRGCPLPRDSELHSGEDSSLAATPFSPGR